jgi:hypothetical protein
VPREPALSVTSAAAQQTDPIAIRETNREYVAMNIYRNTIFLSAVLSASIGQAAYASVVVPDAGGALIYGGVSHSFTGSSASASLGCGALSVSGSPTPTLSATAANCVDAAQAIFNYYFAITGPAALAVPVIVSSIATLSTTGNNQAGFSLGAAGTTLHVDNCLVGVFDAACGTHYFTDFLSLEVNTIYAVGMMTIVSDFLGSGSGNAFLDPFFTIDPTFDNAGDYSFVFSAGVANTPITIPNNPIPDNPVGVPEPGTLTLMGLGLLGMAAVRRSRSPFLPKK